MTGTLKGYDALMNLVLDDVEEVLRGILNPDLTRFVREEEEAKLM